jgi:hypothetical protein
MWTQKMISEAANRPLFEEPTSACEREDPWSGPKGFMFGGMGLPNRPYMETAQQYFDAANLLISDIENLRIEDYNLTNPIFFLYRHWLELMAKEIIGPVHGHNLEVLANKLNSHLQTQGIVVPKWVISRFKEIAAIDPGSTTFRYSDRYIPGETYVSLPHLRRAMAVLNAVLLSLAERGELPHGLDSMVLLERGYRFDCGRLDV